MIKIEKVDVWGFEHAVRGMRNPMNSWDKSDSEYRKGVDGMSIDASMANNYQIGKNDLDLMHRLFIAGTEHRKFLRCLHISMDVVAPLYWWKEYDTYKISTVANSCSTMHKIHAKEFTLDDFSTEHLKDCESVGLTEFYDFPCGRQYTPMDSMTDTIKMLNFWRSIYLRYKDKSAWWQMIQLLPSSYNQRRTLDFNYETATQIIRQRTGHKLDEWHTFVDALWELPYMREIMNGQTGYGCGWVD